MTLLPQSPDAERGVLASLLIAPDTVAPLCASRGVAGDWFFLPVHAAMFSAALKIWSEGSPLDFITLTQRMRDAGVLDEHVANGAAYVTEVFTSLPTAANVTSYLEILREKKMLRDIIAIATEANQRSHTEQDRLDEIIADIHARIAALGDEARHEIPTMKQNVASVLSHLSDCVTDSPSIIHTGLRAIDEQCGPLERGHLLVVAGQGKAGKSMLSGQIALNLALAGQPVCYLSLEMSERELTSRMLASMARVDTRMVKLWSEADYARMHAATQRLAVAPMHIVCRRSGFGEITAIAHQFHARYKAAEKPLACVVLDFAQIATTETREDRKQREIAEIAYGCKRLAAKLDVLFILLSQLNDAGRTREGRDIEHAANLMLEVGHEPESGERGVRVVLARSAPAGEKLALNIVPQHTHIEDLIP